MTAADPPLPQATPSGQTELAELTGLPELLAFSQSARVRGDHDAGLIACRRALALAEAAGDLAGCAEALRQCAAHQIRKGDPESALDSCERAIGLFRELHDDHALSKTLTSQAFAYSVLGLTAEALDVLESSRRIAARLDDPELLFWAWQRTGAVYGDIGDYEQARGFVLNARRWLADLDDEAHFAAANNLALYCCHLGRTERNAGGRDDNISNSNSEIVTEGLGHAAEAVELAARMRNPFNSALTSLNVAVLRGLQGHWVLCHAALARSEELAERHRLGRLRIPISETWIDVLLMQGRAAESVELIEAALPLARTSSEPAAELELLCRLAEALELEGRYAEALTAYRQYHRLEGTIRANVQERRARMIARDLEVDSARADARQARMESETERALARALQADNMALQERASELHSENLRDELTGLGNRRMLESRLPVMWASTSLGGGQLSLALIDIDHFKRINDTYGHAVGDSVLARVAFLLQQFSRHSDLVGRLGGEEFVIAYNDAGPALARRICERLIFGIAHEDWTWIAEHEQITVSVGLQGLADCRDVWEQLERADRAMYVAKRSGRNGVAVGSDR